MENKLKYQIVPTAKEAIKTIATSKDLLMVSKKTNFDATKIRNVLSGNNKKDEQKVFKELRKQIILRLKKEAKIIENIEL